MIIVGVITLVVVLFILLLIPASKTDILGSFGADSVNFGGNASPTSAPAPSITELQGQDLKVGTGSAVVVAGDTISVHYTGYFMDGKKFDSSVDKGTPFVFTVGQGQVIPGFDQGVLGMKVSGQRRVFIPANLAYGAQGQGSIPPNTPLAFDIELLSIDSATLTPSPEASASPTLAP